MATYGVHTVERPAGQQSWSLYRGASMGHNNFPSWPPPQPRELPSIPSGSFPPAGSSQGAASWILEAGRSPAAANLAAAALPTQHVGCAADDSSSTGQPRPLCDDQVCFRAHFGCLTIDKRCAMKHLIMGTSRHTAHHNIMPAVSPFNCINCNCTCAC